MSRFIIVLQLKRSIRTIWKQIHRQGFCKGSGTPSKSILAAESALTYLWKFDSHMIKLVGLQGKRKGLGVNVWRSIVHVTTGI